MDPLALYVVSHRGRSREVKVLSIIKNTAMVQLDGDTLEVAFPADFALDDPTSLRVGSQRYRVTVRQSSDAMTLTVEVDGKPFIVQLGAEPKKRTLRSRWTAAAASPPQREHVATSQKGAVAAVMPGKVVLVKVQPGDRVKAGDPLCVLEAMKMETEVVAPKGGTVTEVKVEPGAPVAKGAVLVVVE